MTDKELDKWWAHLTVESKVEAVHIPYPQCTQYWNVLNTQHKTEIYNRMGGREAHDHHKWAKGNGSLT